MRTHGHKGYPVVSSRAKGAELGVGVAAVPSATLMLAPPMSDVLRSAT